jgi:hypothetical protein
MRYERIIVVADEFSTSDRPFALARRLAAAAGLRVQVVCAIVDDGHGDQVPGWRLRRRLDAHGLSAAELHVLQVDEPATAIADYLAGHDGSLVLRATSAGGHDGGPLLDLVAETIITHIARPLLLLGPRQANPRRDEQLSPITVRDGASDVASLASATDVWTSTFPHVTPHLLEVLPPDPWPGSSVDLSPIGERGPGPVVTELRTLDLDDAVSAYLNGRHDAVVVVSSPRWPSEPSHWWATARRLVRHQTCPVLVVPAVGLAAAASAPGLSTHERRTAAVMVPANAPTRSP